MGKPPVGVNDDVDAPRYARGDTINQLNVEQLHLHGSDLAELRRMAESNPDLASKIVDQRDKEDRREHVSFRFGVLAAIVLVVAILAAFSILMISVGIIGTFLSIMGILAVALLVRVILTGEWSETSWFGKGVTSLVKLLGGKPEDDGSR